MATGKIKVKNGEIEYIKFGKGEKNLVILPGLSYDGFSDKARAIELSYAVFSEDYTVYLIDRNLTPKDNYTVLDIASDTAEALDILGVSRADFFGASLGGMVSICLAINYPKKVNKLVLGSTLSRENETFKKVLKTWKEIAKNGDISELINDINNTIYSPFTLKKYAMVFGKAKITVSDEKTARFITYVGAAENVNLYNKLNKIKAKTFVIGAKNDKVTTVLSAREIAEKLNAKYFEYKRYGHAVFDEAKGYKKKIYKFLKEK